MAALSSIVIIRRGTRSQIKWCIPIQAWILMLVTSMKWARMLPAISAQWNGHHVFVKHDDVCIVSILCVYWSINRSVFCWKSTKILYGMFWVDPRSTTEMSNVFNVHCPSVDTSEEINQYHMHAHRRHPSHRAAEKRRSNSRRRRSGKGRKMGINGFMVLRRAPKIIMELWHEFSQSIRCFPWKNRCRWHNQCPGRNKSQQRSCDNWVMAVWHSPKHVRQTYIDIDPSKTWILTKEL